MQEPLTILEIYRLMNIYRQIQFFVHRHFDVRRCLKDALMTENPHSVETFEHKGKQYHKLVFVRDQAEKLAKFHKSDARIILKLHERRTANDNKHVELNKAILEGYELAFQKYK